MSKIFLTSDQHYGHNNVLQYCNRLFSNIEEMDNVLIENHNRIVGENDIVYMLGDFTLQNLKIAKLYFSLLNGNIRFVANAWHHDRRWLGQLLNESYEQGFESCVAHISTINSIYITLVQPIHVFKFENQVIVLSHYPQRFWDRRHHNSIHFFGHSHSLGEHAPNSLDVGVDMAKKLLGSYRPFSIEEAISFATYGVDMMKLD